MIHSPSFFIRLNVPSPPATQVYLAPTVHGRRRATSLPALSNHARQTMALPVRPRATQFPAERKHPQGPYTRSFAQDAEVTSEQRVTATFKDSTRCKFSVIGDAVAEISEPLPHDVLQPFDDHFHPIRLPTSMPLEKKKSSRAVGHPFHTLNVVPREKQVGLHDSTRSPTY